MTLRAGQDASDELVLALIFHVRHGLGPIATPSEIAIVDRLPKTCSGKIMP